MSKIIIKRGKKKIATYTGTLMVDELNAVVNGTAPNRYSKCEHLFGPKTYAIRK